MEQRGNESAGRERIAKVIARAGLASRREAERLIAAGRVSVNGEVIGSPAVDVGAQDSIAVDGLALPARERTRLFLFHKPRGLLTSHGDPRGRATVFDILPRHVPRLISVGRLDLNTEGLLLLTNDGSLARVLELPATGWLRRYRVRAHGRVAQDRLDGLRGGIRIDGVHYGPIEATVDRVQGANVWLTFAMREGKNREVKNVLGHLGLAVNRLIRVSFGPFTLGDLAPGKIEEVRTRTLREQLGARIAALANADFSLARAEWKEGPGSDGEAEGRPSLRRGDRPKIPPPAKGSTGGLPPPFLAAKNADAKHRPWSKASRVGVNRNDPPHIGTPTRPPVASRRRSTSPLQGEVLPIVPNRHSKKRKSSKVKSSGGLGHVGEPERARREKRRRARPARSRRR
jgi:23S rRNA pseudouridine2605 synthase